MRTKSIWNDQHKSNSIDLLLVFKVMKKRKKKQAKKTQTSNCLHAFQRKFYIWMMFADQCTNHLSKELTFLGNHADQHARTHAHMTLDCRSNHTHTEVKETDSGFDFNFISIFVVSILYLRMESVRVCPLYSCQKRWNFDEIFSCYFFISWRECKTPLTFVHNILPVDITLNEAHMWDNILLWFSCCTKLQYRTVHLCYLHVDVLGMPFYYFGIALILTYNYLGSC